VELSDKIGEVIKNTHFQYERSFVAWTIAIFIALTKHCDSAGGNDVAILSRIKKWRQKAGCAVSFGNTEVKNSCCKSCISAAANRTASLLEI
jgi:hypothetical protein